MLQLYYNEVNEIVDKNNNKYFDLTEKNGKCILNIKITFPKELSGKKFLIRPFFSKPEKKSTKRFPKGCSICRERYSCRFIKINDVSRCMENRENLIKMGYRRR